MAKGQKQEKSMEAALWESANKLLCQQIEQSKNDAAEAKKETRRNKFFAWVTFGVGTAIGIAGIVIGVFL